MGYFALKFVTLYFKGPSYGLSKLTRFLLQFFLDSDKFQSFTIAPCVVAVANVQPQVISSGVLASGPGNALDYGSNGVNICPLTLMAKELLSAKASAGELSERLTNECRDRCLSKLNHNKQQRRVDFDESDSL